MGVGPKPAKNAVRLVVFDFDLTLTTKHVFNTLAGRDKSVNDLYANFMSEPYAVTELGQLRRVLDMPDRGEYESVGGFAKEVFGGAKRLEEIRSLMQDLTSRGVKLVICTRGMPAVVRKLLHDTGLSVYFSRVYGSEGQAYGAGTKYDRLCAQEPPDEEISALLGSHPGWKPAEKSNLCSQLMREWGLGFQHVVLVEDDPDEIYDAYSVCRTLRVKARAGMQAKHFQALKAMADGEGRCGHCCVPLFPLKNLCY